MMEYTYMYVIIWSGAGVSSGELPLGCVMHCTVSQPLAVEKWVFVFVFVFPGVAVIIGYVHARTLLEAVGLHDWQTIVRAKTNHTFHSSRPQLQPNEVHANADPGCMNTKLNSKTAPAAGASEESGHTSSVRSTTASVPRSRFNARSMTENAANTPRKKRETHTKEA
jgi:hypothetical protein